MKGVSVCQREKSQGLLGIPVTWEPIPLIHTMSQITPSTHSYHWSQIKCVTYYFSMAHWYLLKVKTRQIVIISIIEFGQLTTHGFDVTISVLLHVG